MCRVTLPPVVAKVTWQQALAWRMRRQLLDPVSGESAVGVVRRLCAVQAQVASVAELCIRVRRERSKDGDVRRALGDGRLIKTWAMRGTLHLLTPEDAGAFLSLIASGKSWERPSWQRYFGVTPKQLDALREIVRETLDGKVLTREELIAAVTARRGYGHLGDALRSGLATLLKPYAWQGDLCFGPNRGNRVTFVRPEDASPRWVRLPEPEEAAAVAIVAYLRAYAPATVENFHSWLSQGRSARDRFGPGSPRWATGSARSKSAANTATCSRAISTSSCRRDPPRRCVSCPASTSTSSVLAPTIVTSCRRLGAAR